MSKKYALPDSTPFRRQPLTADIDKVLDAAFDDSIPGIIEYVDKFIVPEIGKSLRAAAQKTKPYLKDQAAILQVGFELGQAWQKWRLALSPIPALVEKKIGSDKGAKKALASRRSAEKERRDDVMAAATKLRALPTQIIVGRLQEQGYGKKDKDDKEAFSKRALEDLVRDLKRKKKTS